MYPGTERCADADLRQTHERDHDHVQQRLRQRPRLVGVGRYHGKTTKRRQIQNPAYRKSSAAAALRSPMRSMSVGRARRKFLAERVSCRVRSVTRRFYSRRGARLLCKITLTSQLYISALVGGDGMSSSPPARRATEPSRGPTSPLGVVQYSARLPGEMLAAFLIYWYRSRASPTPVQDRGGRGRRSPDLKLSLAARRRGGGGRSRCRRESSSRPQTRRRRRWRRPGA